MLVEAFEQARGNISHVARMIGTSRPTVHALIKKHGLSSKEFKEYSSWAFFIFMVAKEQ